MKFLNAAAAASMAAAVLCVAACGGHAGGSGLSILPQPRDEAPGAKLGPAPMQTFAPSEFMMNTSDGIHALQVFDQFSSRIITSDQGIADGHRYASIWGVRSPHMASAWHTNNARLNTLLYTPYDTDATGSGLNRPTQWWLAFHPDWVLYECNKKTIAFVPGLPGVPLDISNPEVPQYQAALLGTFAEDNGYDGVAADIVSLKNNTGASKLGRGGCGVWTNGHTTWVAKFSGEAIDAKWALATKNWVSTMHNALHDRAVFARPLALAVNTNVDAYLPPSTFLAGDTDEQTVVANADIIMNEAGFAMWGHYVGDRAFNNAVGWMEYAQSLGKAVLTTDDWNGQGESPTQAQIVYSIATYLMGKEQAAALYVGQSGMYGQENYYPEYGAKIGQACASMYGGPADPNFHGRNLYLRRYSGGLAIVNVNATSAYNVVLPNHVYRDIEGGNVTSPLKIKPNSGFVLLTSGGCN